MAGTNEVKICLPTVDVEQCDLSITQEKAIPTKIVGVVYTKKCPSEVSIDPEIVCVSNDGGLTISKAIAVFDTRVNPPTVVLYDFNNTILTGYTVVQCDDIEYDIEKGGDFCVNGGDLITRYDIINNETKLVESSYWVDVLGVPQATPDISTLGLRPCDAYAKPTYYERLPFCLDGIQWYVRDVVGADGTLWNEYRQGANGSITTTQPTGTINTDGYCFIAPATVTSNIPGVDSIPPTTTKIYSTLTYGTISVLLLGGNADIKADGIIVTFPDGWSGTRSADEKLDYDISITTDANCTALINYVR